MSTPRHVLIHGVSPLFHPAGAGPSPLERGLRRPQGAGAALFPESRRLGGRGQAVVIPIKKVCPEHVDGLIFGFGLSSQKCSAVKETASLVVRQVKSHAGHWELIWISLGFITGTADLP